MRAWREQLVLTRDGSVRREIPRPAGENAGLRDDAGDGQVDDVRLMLLPQNDGYPVACFHLLAIGRDDYVAIGAGLGRYVA
jgi:hypothetical protein